MPLESVCGDGWEIEGWAPRVLGFGQVVVRRRNGKELPSVLAARQSVAERTTSFFFFALILRGQRLLLFASSWNRGPSRMCFGSGRGRIEESGRYGGRGVGCAKHEVTVCRVDQALYFLMRA
jgi:hypothetical protein